ncbi:hypothetical protein Droror1_Dr00010805 [Drosera rotundifolia]
MGLMVVKQVELLQKIFGNPGIHFEESSGHKTSTKCDLIVSIYLLQYFKSEFEMIYPRCTNSFQLSRLLYHVVKNRGGHFKIRVQPLSYVSIIVGFQAKEHGSVIVS